MSDRIALLLAGLIAAAVVLDLLVIRSGSVLFLTRKAAEFVEYLAFWR